LAEGGERDVDQARVLGVELRPAEARRGLGREHGVGPCGEVEKERAAGGAREVERHASLGGVHGEPEEPALGVGDAAPEGRAAARRVAAGRLDLHHVGAEVAEELAGEEAGLARQVEDASAVEVAGQRRHWRWRKAYPIAPVWCYTGAMMKIGIGIGDIGGAPAGVDGLITQAKRAEA